MKTHSSDQTAAAANTRKHFSLSGFSRRMARPSVGRAFSSLNSALRIDDLWDFSLVERLHAPITRRHY
jgi:hypothetical protein